MRRLLFVLCLVTTGLAWPARAEDPPAHDAPHAAAEGAHAEGAQSEPNLLELKLPLAVCTALVFLTLFLILWKFAWGPLAKALDQRERYHQETLEKAEKSRAESERLLAEHRGLMAKAADDVRALIDEAKRDAESAAGTIVARAQQEAEASKQRAERDIGNARDQALADIWTRTADLAVNVAGKVLSREIGPDEHRRLVETAMNQLPAGGPNGQGGRS